MAIPRIWVSQDTGDVQILRVNSSSRYIHISDNSWSPLFQAEAELTAPILSLKVAAEFDSVTFNRIRLAAYLFNETTNAVDALASVTFRLHKVERPNWTDTFEFEVSGTQLLNSYYFSEVDLANLSGLYDGSTTLMIEAVGTRLAKVYRNRIYVNHLGIYDSHIRLTQFVDFLDVTKLDQ